MTGLPEQPPAVSREAIAAAEARVAESEAAMGRRFDGAYRRELIDRLASASPDALRALERGSAPLPLAPGSSTTDLLFTPVTPCRIIDTRAVGAGGALAAGAPRSFYVAGTLGFDTQGGTVGGCGIPLGPAVAVVINFVAVNPTGPGDFRAWRFGGAIPAASILNYAAIGTNLANGLPVPICTGACALDLSVQADVNGAHLVADVTGFFQPYPKSQQNTFSSALVLVNSTNQTFLAGLNNVAVTAGEVIHVMGGFGVWGGGTTQGAACGGGCTTIRGEIAACYQPAGGGTPVVGNHAFIWDTSANYPGGFVTARKGGMFVQHVFTIPAAGNYDFGICGRRDTTAASDADWNIFYPNVVLSRP